MQWVFLVLALWAALVELHTGTFYLAGVAAAALLTTAIGVWVRGDLLIIVFVLLCAVLLAAVLLFRRKRADSKVLPDFDVGQSVSVQTATRPDNRLLVLYRGTNWEAVMDDGAVVAPGDTPIIAGRSDKLLHLVLPPKVAQT
jgi:membrane protein implicated in regulation of membrane protease activity